MIVKLRLAIILNSKQISYVDINANTFDGITDAEKSDIVMGAINRLVDGTSEKVKEEYGLE